MGMTDYIDHFPERMLRIDGETYLYFGGTSYLGLQTHAAFQALFIANIKKYGSNYGASRKSNVQLNIFNKAEKHLATWVGSEACAMLSSGYLAGQLIASHFSADDYACLYAPNTHSALFTSPSKISKTYEELKAAVLYSLKRDTKTIPVVFLDAIDFSGQNYPHFKGLDELPLDQCILVVDDSHGMGIVGNTGGGIFEFLSPLKPKELIVSSSMGKAFGLQAGALLGTKKRIAKLKETALFGGASPPTPASMATLIEAKTIYKKQALRLQENINFFKKGIDAIFDFSWMKNYPVFSFSNPKLTSFLRQHKIIVTNFSYPNETADVMSRIVISAAHRKKDINILTHHINTFFKKSNS